MAIQIYTWTHIKVNEQRCYIDFFMSQSDHSVVLTHGHTLLELPIQ